MPLDVPFDLAALPPNVARVLAAATPPPMRLLAARGAAPGLKPEQLLTVIVLLARGELPHVEEAAKTTAEQTLGKLPAPMLAAALASADLHPAALDVLATVYGEDAATLEKVLTHAAVAVSTIDRLARLGSDAVTELIAVNEQRLLDHPALIEALYANPRTRASTSDRLLDLAVRNGKQLNIPAFREAAEAITQQRTEAPPLPPEEADRVYAEASTMAAALEQELGAERAHEVVKDDDAGEAVVTEKVFESLEQRLAKMTVSQKIKRATLGTGAERARLIRDKNKLVATAVVKSPLLRENEVVSFSASRGVSSDVLREIAASGELVRSHTVKFNLVSNPKTPLQVAVRLLGHLRSDELKRLVKSKGIPAQIAKLARQELDKKRPGS